LMPPRCLRTEGASPLYPPGAPPGPPTQIPAACCLRACIACWGWASPAQPDPGTRPDPASCGSPPAGLHRSSGGGVPRSTKAGTRPDPASCGSPPGGLHRLLWAGVPRSTEAGTRPGPRPLWLAALGIAPLVRGWRSPAQPRPASGSYCSLPGGLASLAGAGAGAPPLKPSPASARTRPCGLLPAGSHRLLRAWFPRSTEAGTRPGPRPCGSLPWGLHRLPGAGIPPLNSGPAAGLDHKAGGWPGRSPSSATSGQRPGLS
jgi:hypothetical protein